jgi:hypothetical protein
MSTDSRLNYSLSRAKSAAHPDWPYICHPFEIGNELSEANQSISLAQWRFFTPSGTTTAALIAFDVPGTPDWLLIHCVTPPSGPMACVRGWIPSAVATDRAYLMSTLSCLIAFHASSAHPMFPSLPTHVGLLPNSPLTPDNVRELMWMACLSIGTRGLGAICDRLDAFKRDPLRRITAELNQRNFDRNTRVEETATRLEFERWWQLATDREHIASETRAVQQLFGPTLQA